MRACVFASLIVSLLLQFAVGAPAGFNQLEIGDPAPNFSLPGFQLPDSEEKQFTLNDFADAKLLLVVFTCNHCPTAQAYESRIIELHEQYKDQDVALVAISPNDNEALRLDELGYSDLGDSLEEMKIRAKERGFTFPYLYDGENQETALAYGAVATPHVFLFDKDRKLRYSGRIDDSDVNAVTSHDARNAIDALLAGKEVPVQKTRTFGCSIKWSHYREQAQASIEKWEQEPVELKPLDEESLAELVKNETDDLLLINVWATWCAPCIAEMSDFVDINRMYRNRNFRMVTISFDEPEQRETVLKILERNHVSSTNYLSTIDSMDQFADILDEKWAGPVPYTLARFHLRPTGMF